ncbi:hypothetical protein TWF694_001008 [Orbilia ellipsospora]|uniref:Uncharacterized protein n=1 Tax=Orbilia ellipsospora TaxID=2528407 RepID=A0AAV9XX04_9PEZI
MYDLKMTSKFFKKRVFRVRSESPDFGFTYGGGYKTERSYSSASDSTNSSESEYPGSKPQATKPHVPQHPIPSMQGPFLESMKCAEVDVENAVNPKDMDLKYHPLIKVIAQIAFGLHLLHKKLAKSETEVVKILQRHVDDINRFLNNATTKFDTALSDIEERHKNLKTAIDNSSVFERMLATDPVFRQQISAGNQKVDVVVKKTTTAMEKNLRDVYEGMRALGELTRYMNSIRKGWKNTGLVRTYGVMVSNVEVWGRCFESLKKAGVTLALSLEKLKNIMGQVDKRLKRAGKVTSKPRKPSLSKDNVKTLKHAQSMPGLPVIPKRTSSLRIRDSALAPLGLRSMLLLDSEISLIAPSPATPKPSLKIQCDKFTDSNPPLLASDKSTFLNVDESDYEDPEHDSPATVTSLTPRPKRPNHWKPLPPTPMSPPADMFVDTFLRPKTSSSISSTAAAAAAMELLPPSYYSSPNDIDNSSPITIELSLEGCLDEETSTFQLRPIYNEHSLTHTKSCSPLTTLQPSTPRLTSAN